MKLPRDIGPIHFVGIGGIGMSGIAEVLVNLGYTVKGSEVSESANVKRLRDKGIRWEGRSREALPCPDLWPVTDPARMARAAPAYRGTPVV
jgi:UDP-N-acetylmuramate--alanine ligase